MSSTAKSIKKIFCVFLTLIMILPCFSVKAATRFTESQECIDLIKSTEGFTKYKYWDYSQWSIGYGTGCGADEYPNGITEAEAEKLLRKYTGAFADYVNDFAEAKNIKLTQNQFDALVCICYALGNLFHSYGEFDLKTILLNGSENYSFLEIARAFGEWRKAGGEVLQGLVKRRELETKLFLKNRTDTKTEVWRVNDESGVNLRSGAGISNSKTGYMVYNYIFAITDKKTGSDGILWGKTNYEGKTHWVALDYCKYIVGGPIGYSEGGNSNQNNTEPTDASLPTEAATTTKNTSEQTAVSETWKITSDNGVKLRSGPGLNYKQIGHVPYNAQIKVTATTECDGYLWGKTSYSGENGWCVLNYAERTSQNQFEGTTLKSIYIAKMPDKTKYNEGDQLNLKGLIVKAVYSDGTEKVVVDYDVSGFESSKGTYDIKVKYINKSTSFRVTVDGKRLTAIEISSLPDKTVYQTGEGLAIKGLKVKGIYSNNTTAELKDFYIENVDGFSKTTGKKKIKVTSNDLEAEFEVEVTEKILKGIEITSPPESTSYITGQSLDESGMIVHAVYSNGTKNIIDNYTVSGYDSGTVGQQTITVKYSGFTDTFDVNVSEPDIYELPGDLDGSGTRDIFDLVLLNKYMDGICEIESERTYLADVNMDGTVNSKDVDALSRIVSQQ